jgi:hypothetical protein
LNWYSTPHTRLVLPRPGQLGFNRAQPLRRPHALALPVGRGRLSLPLAQLPPQRLHLHARACMHEGVSVGAGMRSGWAFALPVGRGRLAPPLAQLPPQRPHLQSVHVQRA